jgi:hypothetical protein
LSKYYRFYSKPSVHQHGPPHYGAKLGGDQFLGYITEGIDSARIDAGHEQSLEHADSFAAVQSFETLSKVERTAYPNETAIDALQ